MTILDVRHIPYLAAVWCFVGLLRFGYTEGHYIGIVLVYFLGSLAGGIIAFRRRQSFWIGWLVCVFATPFIGWGVAMMLEKTGRSGRPPPPQSVM